MQRLQQLEKEYTMAHNLAKDEEIIWIDINKSMTKIWPLIQIIFEKELI